MKKDLSIHSVVIESPTRVDLAGGTLDMWPLYCFVSGACTINLAIDIKTRCELRLREDQQVWLYSDDIGLDERFESLTAFFSSSDPKLFLLQTLFNFAKPETGFELKTSSQSPVGGGLGGSSSLTVSILKAMQQLKLIANFSSVEEFAQVAANLEACILKTPTGTQDYIPAITGGLNLIEYGFEGHRVQTLPVPRGFSEKLILVYTGRSHQSGINNFEVLQRAVSKEVSVLSALGEIKSVSEELREVLASENYDRIAGLLEREFKARLNLADSFASPEIREIQKLAEIYPEARVKICGAGGGGCVLIWCPNEEHRTSLAQSCEESGFKVLPFQAVEPI